MNDREMTRYCIDQLVRAGAGKAQCLLQNSEKNELNVEANEVNLLRTVHDTDLYLTAIIGDRKGTASSNKLDKDALDDCIERVLQCAASAEPDAANDIAENHPAKAFHSGPEKGDYDAMYDRLQAFLTYVRNNYPLVNLREIYFAFTKKTSFFANSNGVDYISRKGLYACDVGMSAQEEKQTSSFNYTGFATKSLDKELQDYGSLDGLLRQTGGQIHTTPLKEKFIGDVIITPDCLEIFLWEITGIFLSNYSLISGTSLLKDKLNEQVADQKFSLHSRPVSGEIADDYFFTSDGFEAQDITLIDRGILKSFLLDLYGSRKTGKPRALNNGGAFVVDPGNSSLEEMIRTVEKGVLMGRFSGSCGTNGDFSGVAKNSYYIEKGKILYPLSETMVSGNLVPMLNAIQNISKERIDFGLNLYPWIQVGGLTISGK
jgi:PmbA protein